MRKDEVFESKFMKAAWLKLPNSDEFGTKVLTIAGPVVWSEPFQDGRRQRVVSFCETDKKLGLNNVNWNSVAKIAKIDDDDRWEGVKVELWVDENVQFGGDIVEAIRIRRPAGVANGVVDALKQATGSVAASELPVATKITAWAAWKNAAANVGDTADVEKFKVACGIEAANNKIAIERFTAINWANVAQAYKASGSIDDSDIPY